MIKLELIKHTHSVKDTLIFVGNGNRDFGLRVASYFPGCLSKCKISRFSDGEIEIPKIEENVRKKNCIIIQTVGISTQGSVNDMLLELLVLIDAIKRSSAATITVVLPIFPYQRQDKKSYSRSPITASLISTILENLDISRVICFDLHAGQIQGFFNKTPLDNLFTEPYFIQYIKNMYPDNLSDLVIVSPDEGGVKRATRVAKKLNCRIAILYKERNKPNVVDSMVLLGQVQDSTCFIIDDMIDTGGTACKAAHTLKENGAKNIYMGVCHGVLSGKAIDKINQSAFDKVIVTNTMEITERFGKIDKIDVIDISEMCASAIYRSLTGESISELINL